MMQRSASQAQGTYRPRFKLDARVLRVPIVPGCDPKKAYGDLAGRGVRGIVLEAFGVGNMPDAKSHGWLPWLRTQRSKGLQVGCSRRVFTVVRVAIARPSMHHTL